LEGLPPWSIAPAVRDTIQGVPAASWPPSPPRPNKTVDAPRSQGSWALACRYSPPSSARPSTNDHQLEPYKKNSGFNSSPSCSTHLWPCVQHGGTVSVTWSVAKATRSPTGASWSGQRHPRPLAHRRWACRVGSGCGGLQRDSRWPLEPEGPRLCWRGRGRGPPGRGRRAAGRLGEAPHHRRSPHHATSAGQAPSPHSAASAGESGRRQDLGLPIAPTRVEGHR
jgi:hypothetical protein